MHVGAHVQADAANQTVVLTDDEREGGFGTLVVLLRVPHRVPDAISTCAWYAGARERKSVAQIGRDLRGIHEIIHVVLVAARAFSLLAASTRSPMSLCRDDQWPVRYQRVCVYVCVMPC